MVWLEYHGQSKRKEIVLVKLEKAREVKDVSNMNFWIIWTSTYR